MALNLNVQTLIGMVQTFARGIEPDAAARSIEQIIRRQGGDIPAFWAATHKLARERMAAHTTVCGCPVPDPIDSCARCGGHISKTEVLNG